MVADIIVELSFSIENKTFTYNIKKEQEQDAQVGKRVRVEFGKQILEGFIIKIRKKEPKDQNLKDIIEVKDKETILNEELLKLGQYISKTTLSSLISAYQSMLPRGLKARKHIRINQKVDKFITINEDINLDEIKLNKTQQKIINILKKDYCVNKTLLNKISPSSIKTLLKNNILQEQERLTYRYNLKHEKKQDFTLYKYQQKVYNEIISNPNDIHLLRGVTGSGKTNIYIKIIEHYLKQNKTAIMLVPEISLTPQIVKRFTSYFKDKVAVLHSGLSDAEKYDEWIKINKGEISIVIGARSAIFAPLKNIGVIIIDEEHSTTYKQDNTPRYHALEIAKKRASYHHASLILGSATPKLESYARALKKVYHLVEMDERPQGSTLPEVKIIDMNKEFKKAKSYLSDPLITQIKEKLQKKEQVILFLNKRGYSTFLSCSSCSNTIKCPNCDITLTYHKTSNMLRCHYCGYATTKKETCPVCHEKLQNFGIGTEQVEEEITKIIKEAKVVRMDIDTTTKKGAHERIINDFMNEKYNILLGTQMIAKGLDFPKVTLVGVINADISLNYPDFRSSEYTYQLLEQVSGRSGRSNLKGKVLIQTFNPDHYAIKHTKTHDYKAFFKDEMKLRKMLKYPPYYYLVRIRIISKDYNLASKTSKHIGNILKNNLKKEIVLGPSIANIFRVNNQYRFQIIIKYKSEKNIIPILTKINNHYYDKRNIKVEIDFDPTKM